MLDAPGDFAATLSDDLAGLDLKQIPERVVGRQEEPGGSTCLHQRSCGGVCQKIGVEDPVHGIRRALRARQFRARRARHQTHDVLLARDGRSRKCDG